jgi:hypothetical protein
MPGLPHAARLADARADRTTPLVADRPRPTARRRSVLHPHVKLPQPSRVDHRMLTFERIDQTDRDVVLEPLGRSLESADAELRLVVADGAWTTVDDSST